MNEAFRPDREEISVSPTRRRNRAAYVAIVVALAAGIAAASTVVRQRHTDESPTTEPVPALTVTITRPERAVWPMTLEASGAIAAWQEASIGAQVGGYRVIEVLVNVGDQV